MCAVQPPHACKTCAHMAVAVVLPWQPATPTDTSKQAARIHCATMGWTAAEALIERKDKE